VETIPGRVIRLQSGFYTVATGQGVVVCHLRGRLKKRTIHEEIVAVGDAVRIMILPEGSGMIEEVEPRRSAFSRLDPQPKGFYRQILLANPDQLVLVFACAQPVPHLRMLDRFLVVAEKNNIPGMIVVNKVDLIGLEKAMEIFSIYPKLGYPLLLTSTRSGEGVEALRQKLLGRISAFAGPSGVGKTSLLNHIQPELGLKVREVYDHLDQKGRHTTNVREMFPIDGGGYVADLPGLRSLALWDTQPEELDGYFPELRGLVADCQFNDCTHRDEPGCAVIQALSAGRIDPERYKSYLKLRFGDRLI
jgi:ribosome biogenesis GTPase / thiamine phosphate phosphatase